MTISISATTSNVKSAAFLSKGFRPFFLGAGLYALLSMLVWGAVYFMGFDLPLGHLTPFQWHAQGLVFGYAGAVIAGFLLTAVINWTGRETLAGKPLLMLFMLWVMARLSWFLGGAMLMVAGLLDLLFWLALFIVLAKPIIEVRQWRQLSVLSKLLFIAGSYCWFYAAVLGYSESGADKGIYLALMVEIGLILMISRRVFPFFAQAGLGMSERLPCPVWIDRASLLLLVTWLLIFILVPDSFATAIVACMMSVTLSARLWYWYTAEMWRAPLLWSLYLGLASIALGFALLAGSYFVARMHFLGIHALAYGGLGLITFSMMSRVALGHTGRDVRGHYPLLTWALILLLTGAVSRVIVPLLVPDYIDWAMRASQLFWVLAFALFLWIYVPILIRPRPDGMPG